MSSPAPRSVNLLVLRLNPRSTWIVIELVDQDGARGYGECSDAGSAADVARLLLEVCDGGPDRAWSWALNECHGALLARTVASGYSTAWADLESQRAGVPACAWLAGERVEPRGAPVVRTYANINRATRTRTPEGFAERAADAVAAGYTAIKLAPFDGLAAVDRADYGMHCVEAVRQEIGGACDLMVDVHANLSVAEYESISDRINDVNLHWLEDPCSAEDLDGLRRIRELCATRIAGGETLAVFADFAPLLDAGVIDIAMPDVKHAGGPRALRALARELCDSGVEVSPHNPTGPFATDASGHVLWSMGGGLLEVMHGESGERAGSVLPRERSLAHGWCADLERSGMGRTPGAAWTRTTLKGAR